jgi:hypothetical protein
MSGGDGKDSTLEYPMLDARGFLLLRPFVPGALAYRFPRPRAGDAYPLWGAFEHACLGTRVYVSG